MTKEQQIKIQRCIDEFYSNRPQVRDELGAALQVLYEAESVKHGRWETCRSGHDAVCTNCHKYWVPIEDKYDFWFCPRCGADMREVEE